MDRAAERRLAAILITDVVGYSRMVSADEAGTLRRLRALRRDVIDPHIAASRGRIVKSTGDGVIAEFPSSVRAVACAVVIQQAAGARNAGLPEGQALHMRIGINLGDVFAEPDGDLYGDGVNVAARLEPLAEPGGLCVARSVHDQVRDRLPYRFEDCGKRELKNIARPVGVFSLSAAAIQSAAPVEDEAEPAVPSTMTAIAPQRRTPWPVWAGAALLLAAAGGGLGWWAWSAPWLADKTLAVQAGLPAKPLPPLSLVVLPFTNAGNDPEQEFFADGLTDDLTTDLSHLAGSFVIARNTAFTYKGKAVDVRQLGHDLGVRYVLSGSVRRPGERVVLNAQLTSTETGAQLWADRFEGERGRLGELQTEFVARLARSLDVQLTQAESLRSLRERPNNPDAADLAMRGWNALNRPRSPENLAEAIEFFERSTAIDADNIQSRLGLARATVLKLSGGLSQDRRADIEKSDAIISRVLISNQYDAIAHMIKGDIYRIKKQFPAAIAESDLAISLNKNLSVAWHGGGVSRMFNGQAAESFAFLETAIRLSPRDPLLNFFEFNMCHSHTHLGQWEKAIEWCQKSIAHGPFWLAYIDLTACYAWLGRDEEAKRAMAELMRFKPGFGVGPWRWTDWTRLIDRLAGSSKDEDHGTTPFPQHRVQAAGRAGVPVRRDATRLGQAPRSLAQPRARLGAEIRDGRVRRRRGRRRHHPGL